MDEELFVGWFPAMKSIKKILTESEALKNFSIYLGSKGSAKTYPCIEIIWDNETGISIHNDGGATGLWVDVYVRRGDNRPDEEAYEELFTAQNEIIRCLKTFPRSLLSDYGIATNPDIKQIVSDGAESSANFGGRMSLSASRK